jgi:hypothetical protein
MSGGFARLGAGGRRPFLRKRKRRDRSAMVRGRSNSLGLGMAPMVRKLAVRTTDEISRTKNGLPISPTLTRRGRARRGAGPFETLIPPPRPASGGHP